MTRSPIRPVRGLPSQEPSSACRHGQRFLASRRVAPPSGWVRKATPRQGVKAMNIPILLVLAGLAVF